MLIIQSVDNIVVATEAALISALFVTNKGSIIPAFTISTVFPVTTSNPLPSCSGSVYSFTPAFVNISSLIEKTPALSVVIATADAFTPAADLEVEMNTVGVDV